VGLDPTDGHVDDRATTGRLSEAAAGLDLRALGRFTGMAGSSIAGRSAVD
jgi:hypothetical protein